MLPWSKSAGEGAEPPCAGQLDLTSGLAIDFRHRHRTQATDHKWRQHERGGYGAAGTHRRPHDLRDARVHSTQAPHTTGQPSQRLGADVAPATEVINAGNDSDRPTTRTGSPGQKRQRQLHSARIRSAFLTSSSEPVKLNFIFPARRVMITLIVDKPLRCIRK